jgi:hypothetical protein
MASRMLWASRAASFLRVSAFQRGFASGMSDFFLYAVLSVLMGDSLFAFRLYLLIGKKMNACIIFPRLQWGCGSLIYVFVKMLDLWFFQQNIWLSFRNGVCLLLSSVSYLPSFGFYYCRDQWVLDLRQIFLWILFFSMKKWNLSHCLARFIFKNETLVRLFWSCRCHYGRWYRLPWWKGRNATGSSCLPPWFISLYYGNCLFGEGLGNKSFNFYFQYSTI